MTRLPVHHRQRRPQGLVDAIEQLRSARILLVSVYRINEAAELKVMIERLEASSRASGDN